MTTTDEPEEYLGTPPEARAQLGVDMADLWEMVSAGILRAERDEPGAPWRIYR